MDHKTKKERSVFMEEKNLKRMDNFLSYEEKINVNDKTFEKLMFIYSIAVKEIKTKLEILKDEFKVFYNYDLIDHINTRVKSPKSIIKKMKDKECELTYKAMIENIGDIAGIRVICPLKKDIYSVKNLIEKIPGIRVIKEKDYVKNPKKSGYASYHQIVEIPISLSQNVIYVRAEIQIRTMAMDFWASLEHKLKYKNSSATSKSVSKELISYAKTINKLDNKMSLLSE